MPEQVGLVIGPTGATGGPIAAALAHAIIDENDPKRTSLRH